MPGLGTVGYVRELRQTVLQVRDAAADGSDAGGGKLAPGYGKRLCERVDIDVVHQRPVDHDAVLGHPLRIPGAFAPLDENVIPPAKLRRNTQSP